MQDLKDKLEESELHLEQTVREKDRVISAKDEEIQSMKNKMEVFLDPCSLSCTY